MVKNSKIDVNGVSERIKKSHPTFLCFTTSKIKRMQVKKVAMFAMLTLSLFLIVALSLSLRMVLLI